LRRHRSLRTFSEFLAPVASAFFTLLRPQASPARRTSLVRFSRAAVRAVGELRSGGLHCGDCEARSKLLTKCQWIVPEKPGRTNTAVTNRALMVAIQVEK
jgi:hypothetical protein